MPNSQDMPTIHDNTTAAGVLATLRLELAHHEHALVAGRKEAEDLDVITAQVAMLSMVRNLRRIVDQAPEFE